MWLSARLRTTQVVFVSTLLSLNSWQQLFPVIHRQEAANARIVSNASLNDKMAGRARIKIARFQLRDQIWTCLWRGIGKEGQQPLREQKALELFCRIISDRPWVLFRFGKGRTCSVARVQRPPLQPAQVAAYFAHCHGDASWLMPAPVPRQQNGLSRLSRFP